MCPVSTDPARIAEFLEYPGNTRTVFDTYHSLGVSLAIDGLAEADENEDGPGRLPGTIAFANTIARSKWYAGALMDCRVLNTTTGRLEGDQRAMKLEAVHLDASSTTTDRNIELREPAAAGETRAECRVISNYRPFNKGGDVPNLTSILHRRADAQVFGLPNDF